MSTLRELVDENYAGGQTIAVLSPVGEELGRIRPGEEEDSFALARLMGGQVIRAVQAQDAVYAYVSPPPEAPGARSQTPSVYQGPIADEAAWSADWRSRERKASDKQLSFIRRNMPLYLAIRKPEWPEDPKLLLAHEASDAMTIMIPILRDDD